MIVGFNSRCALFDAQDPNTKVGKGAHVVKTKLAEACTGYIKPVKRVYNAFRSDDPEAIIPQHDWKQGPDFRASAVGAEAGYALVGAKRPKKMHGGDAPTATSVFLPAPSSGDGEGDNASATEKRRTASCAGSPSCFLFWEDWPRPSF